MFHCLHAAGEWRGDRLFLGGCFQEEFWLTPAPSNDMFICNIWSQEPSLGDRDLETRKQKKARLELKLLEELFGSKENNYKPNNDGFQKGLEWCTSGQGANVSAKPMHW